jgi:hypothetical protein
MVLSALPIRCVSAHSSCACCKPFRFIIDLVNETKWVAGFIGSLASFGPTFALKIDVATQPHASEGSANVLLTSLGNRRWPNSGEGRKKRNKLIMPYKMFSILKTWNGLFFNPVRQQTSRLQVSAMNSVSNQSRIEILFEWEVCNKVACRTNTAKSCVHRPNHSLRLHILLNRYYHAQIRYLRISPNPLSRCRIQICVPPTPFKKGR